jgi:hypothetical protein
MAPPEVDNFIQPSDSTVFAECLETLEVSRFEIDDPKGSPRSFSIKFGFKENAYFANRTLEKKFWFRSSLDGWQGLVSEPVQIMWKKGKDLTEGLTDAAYRLSIATQKLSLTDPKARGLPEYKSLASKVESSEEASNSFFAWFGFVSSYKWVSAEESEKANKIEAERMEKRRRGEKVEDDDDDEDDDMEQDFQETEVFPGGDELATILAEDMWPSAIKYYSKESLTRSTRGQANRWQSKPMKQTRKMTRISPSLKLTWRTRTIAMAMRSISGDWWARAETKVLICLLQRSRERLSWRLGDHEHLARSVILVTRGLGFMHWTMIMTLDKHTFLFPNTLGLLQYHRNQPFTSLTVRARVKCASYIQISNF